jgi:hypothetical protein
MSGNLPFRYQDYTKRECSHEQYYGQIARVLGIKFPCHHPLVQQCANMGENNWAFSGIEWNTWLDYTDILQEPISKEMELRGETYTPTGAVQVIREAVRLAVKALQFEQLLDKVSEQYGEALRNLAIK